jgi:hypothetical protein
MARTAAPSTETERHQHRIELPELRRVVHGRLGRIRFRSFTQAPRLKKHQNASTLSSKSVHKKSFI